MIGVWALLGGSLCGIVILVKVFIALGYLGGDCDGGRGAAIRKAKKDWWASLSADDKAEFKLHERRKAKYVALRARLCEEVRRRRKAEFDRTGVDPDLRVANEVWREWRMDEWDDVNLAPDCPETMPSDGGQMFLGSKPASVWEPPKWR
jgi:hypothetical protein